MITELIIESKCQRQVKALKRKHYDINKFKYILKLFSDNEISKLTPFKPHKLKGIWHDFWELHIDSDWLLIYYFIPVRDQFDNIVANKVVVNIAQTGNHDMLRHFH